MKISEYQQKLLRKLPGVDNLLADALIDPATQSTPKNILVRAIRETIEQFRTTILNQPDTIDTQSLTPAQMITIVARQAEALRSYNLQRTINATGVVVHTNLGRSCLAQEAIDHMTDVAQRYSNLEFDLSIGKRGSRYSAVEDLLCELTGAQSAIAVNNNAGAVLLCLDTLARGKEVIVSRGELVEIGGSFRIPDVMAKSGAHLKEVGTTNRTHTRDYEQAITTDTGLLLKVHASNYSIIGFTATVPLAEMVGLGRQFNLPVMEDLGSGNFIDLTRYGLTAEPTVQDSVAAGIDVITFSGDKMLGGPQAGLIVGQKKLLDQIKTNPLTRALRIDKLTLAALEATLRLYRDERQVVERIPTLRMLLSQYEEIEARAQQLADGLHQLADPRLNVDLKQMPSRVGGGALPLLALPSCCVCLNIEGVSINRLESDLRKQKPAIIGRIENDQFIMDPRTIQMDEIECIIQTFNRLLKQIDPVSS